MLILHFIIPATLAFILGMINHKLSKTDCNLLSTYAIIVFYIGLFYGLIVERIMA